MDTDTGSIIPPSGRRIKLAQTSFEDNCREFLEKIKECIHYFAQGHVKKHSLTPQEEYEKAYASVQSETHDGTAGYDYFINVNFEAIAEPRFNIDCALAHYFQAKREYDENDINLAWATLSHAEFLLGIAFGAAQSQSNDSRIMQSKGGQAKAKSYQPIKDKVIFLLEERKPDCGWKSKVQAISDIIDSVGTFVTDERIAAAPSNLKHLITRWSKQDDGVRAAFQRTAKRRKS